MESDKILKANQAESLLKNSLLSECFETIRAELFRQFERSDTSTERDQVYYKLQSMTFLQRELKRLLNNKIKAESKT
jgi:hypothetical protein